MMLNKLNIYFFIFLIFIAAFPYILYSKDSSIYDLLATESIEEIKKACRVRGLSDSGDIFALKQRLMKYEASRRGFYYNERVKNIKKGDLFLSYADYVSAYRDRIGDEIFILFGNVKIEYFNKLIKANVLRVNYTKKIVVGSGNITYIDGKSEYRANGIYYNLKEDRGIFYNAETYLGNFIYKGKNIKKISGESKYIGQNVSLTTCNLSKPHYIVKADKLYYFDSTLVLIKNMKLFFGEDDILEIPYYFKNLKEQSFKTSVFFRDRSGLVVQNTYFPLKNNRNELKLMGDYYERLGFYTGFRWLRSVDEDRLELNASCALSNRTYYYENISENWSQFIPSGTGKYNVLREFRYRLGASGYKVIKNSYKNKLEFNWEWIKDPYYSYDFERRYEEFSIAKLVGESENDYPAKSGPLNWNITNNFNWNDLNASLVNYINFYPQRNLSEDVVYYPDYYQYRLYSALLPGVDIQYSNKISGDGIFGGASYLFNTGYDNRYYFDERGRLNKHAHSVQIESTIYNSYLIGNYLSVEPSLQAGVNIKKHENPTSEDTLDDKRNSLLFGKFENDLRIGGDELYFGSKYRIKYKLAGPDDNYEYGNFREHDITLGLYLKKKRIQNKIYTSLDLKPVYDWTSRRYSFTLSGNRFMPVVEEVSYLPCDYLSFNDTLIYDVSEARFKTNAFLFNFDNENFRLFKKDLEVSWSVNWQHNFINPEVDFLTSTFFVKTKLLSTLDVYLGFYSRNDEMWRYFTSTSKKYGVERINPLTDLLKSFNFFNINDRKESNFKLKAFSFGFVHDLHEWELKFDYTGRHELSYDRTRYVWNNIYSISIGLKKVKNARFTREFSNTR